MSFFVISPASNMSFRIFMTHATSAGFSLDVPSGETTSPPSTGTKATGLSQSGQSKPAGANRFSDFMPSSNLSE